MKTPTVLRFNKYIVGESGFPLIGPEYYTIREQALTCSEVVDLFHKNATNATVRSDKSLHALALLKGRIKAKYYSGIDGCIRQLFNCLFGCYNFEKTEIAHKLQKTSEIIEKLPEKKKVLPPTLKTPLVGESLSSAVFTDNLKDGSSIGAIADFTCRHYDIQWMPPADYLKLVDPKFKRHSDEESMPWIASKMRGLIEGTSKGPKFSPLMMRKSVSHKVVGHEGRHRALTAKRLGIPHVPVAVMFEKSY